MPTFIFGPISRGINHLRIRVTSLSHTETIRMRLCIKSSAKRKWVMLNLSQIR